MAIIDLMLAICENVDIGISLAKRRRPIRTVIALGNEQQSENG